MGKEDLRETRINLRDRILCREACFLELYLTPREKRTEKTYERDRLRGTLSYSFEQ